MSRINKFLFLVALAAGFAIATPASAATNLASYLTNTNPGESIYRDIGGNKYDGACQPFTISAGNYRVTAMQAYLKKTGSPTEALRFRIYASAGGSNCATNLGSLIGGNDAVPAASVTGSYSYVSAVPSGNIDLVTATTYFFVIDTANQGTNDTTYYQWGIGNSGIPYSSSYYKYNGAFAIETGYNVNFEIDGDPTPAAAVTLSYGIVSIFGDW